MHSENPDRAGSSPFGQPLIMKKTDPWSLVGEAMPSEQSEQRRTARSSKGYGSADSVDGLRAGAPTPANGSGNAASFPEDKKPSDDAVTRVESQLSEIWRAIFKNENIGLQDDFFLLGG